MNTNTKSQIRKIHTLKAYLNLSDDVYREMLFSFGVNSSKDLTFTEAQIFIEILEDSDGNKLFRTKGDNNNVADSSFVKEGELSGKVIMKIPKIGYIQYFISRKYGWLIAVVIPCAGIIIYDILKIFKSMARGIANKTASKKKHKK